VESNSYSDGGIGVFGQRHNGSWPVGRDLKTEKTEILDLNCASAAAQLLDNPAMRNRLANYWEFLISTASAVASHGGLRKRHFERINRVGRLNRENSFLLPDAMERRWKPSAVGLTPSRTRSANDGAVRSLPRYFSLAYSALAAR
jgi:hypothetical protein